MRIAKYCLLLSLLLPSLSNAGPNSIPKKLKTGGAPMALTREEQFQAVMGQLGGLGQNYLAQVQVRARIERMQAYARILPEWANRVPFAILEHANFDENDTAIQRARKFIRVALLIRDMYQELPINHFLHTADTPPAERLVDAERHELVGMAFAAAAEIAAHVETGTDRLNEADLWLSLAQLEHWAVYQYLQGDVTQLQPALRRAQDALTHADLAQRALPEGHPAFDEGIAHVRREIPRLFSNLVAPIFFIAIQAFSLNAKSGSKLAP